MKKFKAGKNISFENSNSGKSWWKGKQMIWLIVGFIIILMIGSVLTMMFEKQDNVLQEVEENGYKFSYTQEGVWAAKIGGQDISFAYLPSELRNISRDPYFYLSNDKTYVIFNGNEFNENSREIGIIMGFLRANGRPVFAACADEKNCLGDLPIVNCENKLNNTNVVYIYIANETKIEKNNEQNNNNCLRLETKPGDELKLINLFVYQLLGVVKQ